LTPRADAGSGKAMATDKTNSASRADRVELILAQLRKLPTLPSVATRLLSLTASAQADARQVARLIGSDQSLTAKVLSLARRAAAPAGDEVLTVERAVVFLGFETIRNTVLSMKIYEVFGPAGQHPDSPFDRIEFWKHSLGVACGASLLARRLNWRIKPEDAFVCGLLHDLGKVALDECLPKSFARVMQQAMRGRKCLTEIEQEVIGIDHTIAGRRLGQHWELPDAVVDSMWLHQHAPESLPPELASANMVKIIYLANLMAHEQRVGFSGNFVHLERPADVAGRFGITTPNLTSILEALPKQVCQRAELLGLTDVTSESLYIQAMSQATEELTELNESLRASARAHQQRQRYFDALAEMNRTLRPASGVGEVCLAGAAAVRAALDVSAVVLWSVDPEQSYCSVAVSDGHADGVEVLDTTETTEASRQVLALGAHAGLIPAPIGHGLLARYADRLGAGPYWLLPLACHGRLVALAAFPGAAPEAVTHASELAALSSAIGLAIANAAARAAADSLGEDLAEASRRLQQVQAELLKSRSLQAIAEMAAGAAHERNTPLAIISGRAQQLREEATDPRTHHLLDIVHQQAHRCSQIVSELMEFAHPTTPTPEVFEVGPLVEELRQRWLERTRLSPDQLTIDVPTELPPAHADPQQVRQIMDELVANATASAEPDTLRLAVNCRSDPSDDCITIAVEDNGCGMPPDIQAKAFDPFFSHRPAGRGRGLGLAKALRLAEGNMAKLWLESEAGRGTTAYVRLPTHQAALPS